MHMPVEWVHQPSCQPAAFTQQQDGMAIQTAVGARGPLLEA